MKYKDYMNGILKAKTAEDLELAIQADYGHHNPSARKAIREQSERICVNHPYHQYIPISRRENGKLSRNLEICGKLYVCGPRYGHYYGEGAEDIFRKSLIDNGFPKIAIYRIWDWANSIYLHRCLPIIYKSMSGMLCDPPMNCLILVGLGNRPIKMSESENDFDRLDNRATRACPCGGTLFDWGSGFIDGFNQVNWRCNRCPRIYREWVTSKRFREIRQSVLTFS